jgi:hypothetical protein
LVVHEPCCQRACLGGLTHRVLLHAQG